MWGLDRTNLFRSTPDGEYYAFQCYASKLRIDETDFWSIHRSIDLPKPYSVFENHLYFTNENMMNHPEFRKVASPDVTDDTLSAESEKGETLIRNLTHGSVREMLSNHRFSSSRAAGRRLFYVDGNPKYVMKMDSKEGSYTVYRGFSPRVLVRPDLGSVDIRFAPERKFRIEIPDDGWKHWIGFPVKVSGRCDIDIDFTSRFELLDVDEDRESATVHGDGLEYEVDTEFLYVPASPGVLRLRSMYQVMNQFSHFAENGSKSIVNYLMEFLNTFSSDGKFVLQYNSEMNAMTQFCQVMPGE